MWNDPALPNMYGVYGAPMPNFVPGAKVDELYNTYQQMLAANPIYQQQQQMLRNRNANPAMGQQGTFIQVNDYKEVDSYPVAPNGVPTLFFDYEHMMFWSKKCINGQATIQPFAFMPLNSSDSAPTETPAASPQKDKDGVMEKLEALTKRLAAVEEQLGGTSDV